MPSFESAFRNLYLNQRVDAESPLIPRSEWLGCKTGDVLEEGSEVYLGLDLSGKTDLTALVAVSADPAVDIISAWFWKPEDMLQEHENRDRVPYMAWKRAGYIEACPGRTINFDWVVHRLAEITGKFKVVGMAYDRWRIDDLYNAMSRLGLEAYVDRERPPEKTGDTATDARNKIKYQQLLNQRSSGLRMVNWGQGYKDMSEAVDVFEVSVLERKLKHDGNPVLTWNVSNTVTIADPAGNRKIDKTKTRFRIDGVVALVMALGLKSRDLDWKPEPSSYESRGLEFF
jgi:phage terminase large subunit-like protein